jgi:uncharacterized membrane protein YkoI
MRKSNTYRLSQRDRPKAVRLYLLPAILFLVIIGANIYVFKQASHSTKPITNLFAGNTQGLTSSLPSSLLTLEKVRQLASIEAPDNVITKIELENKDEQLVYVVSLENNSQLVFDAQTGVKLSQSTTDGEQISAALPADYTPSISFAAAGDIASAKKPSGSISKIKLGQEDGEVIYTVEFTDQSEITVAADDGTVVETTSPEPEISPETPTGTNVPSNAASPTRSNKNTTDQNINSPDTSADTSTEDNTDSLE